MANVLELRVLTHVVVDGVKDVSSSSGDIEEANILEVHIPVFRFISAVQSVTDHGDISHTIVEDPNIISGVNQFVSNRLVTVVEKGKTVSIGTVPKKNRGSTRLSSTIFLQTPQFQVCKLIGNDTGVSFNRVTRIGVSNVLELIGVIGRLGKGIDKISIY